MLWTKLTTDSLSQNIVLAYFIKVYEQIIFGLYINEYKYIKVKCTAMPEGNGQRWEGGGRGVVNVTCLSVWLGVCGVEPLRRGWGETPNH